MLRAVSSVWHTFQACGFMSWFCLLASLLADVLGVVAVVVALLRVRWARPICWPVLALVVAFLPAGLGVVGMGLGRAKVDEVITSGVVDPSVVERIRQEGYSEASCCVSVGATLSAAPLLLAAMALAHTLRARRSDG
jgi:hypothetical protein